jgi:hypothetical protein
LALGATTRPTGITLWTQPVDKEGSHRPEGPTDHHTVSVSGNVRLEGLPLLLTLPAAPRDGGGETPMAQGCLHPPPNDLHREPPRRGD